MKGQGRNLSICQDRKGKDALKGQETMGKQDSTKTGNNKSHSMLYMEWQKTSVTGASVFSNLLIQLLSQDKIKNSAANRGGQEELNCLNLPCLFLPALR